MIKKNIHLKNLCKFTFMCTFLFITFFSSKVYASYSSTFDTEYTETVSLDFKNANLNAAVNLDPREGNKVFLGYHSTQKVDNARIILRNGDQVVLEKEISISPKKPFTQLVDLKAAYKP